MNGHEISTAQLVLVNGDAPKQSPSAPWKTTHSYKGHFDELATKLAVETSNDSESEAIYSRAKSSRWHRVQNFCSDDVSAPDRIAQSPACRSLDNSWSTRPHTVPWKKVDVVSKRMFEVAEDAVQRFNSQSGEIPTENGAGPATGEDSTVRHPAINGHDQQPAANNSGSKSDIKSRETDAGSQCSSDLSDFLDDAISLAGARAAARKPRIRTATPRFLADERVGDAPGLSEGDGSPFVHTFSTYRRGLRRYSAWFDPISEHGRVAADQNKGHKSEIGPTDAPIGISPDDYNQKVRSLQEKVAEKQSHLEQLRRALQYCKDNGQFRGSMAEVDTRTHLVITGEHCRSLNNEKQLLDDCYRNLKPYYPSPPLGQITISETALSLRRDFQSQTGHPEEIYYFFCLLKYRDLICCTETVNSDVATSRDSLTFSNEIQFHNLPANFAVSVEVYAMRTVREKIMDNTQLNGSTKSSKSGSLKRRPSLFNLFTSASPTTKKRQPNGAVEASFRLAGRLTITLASINRRKLTLREHYFERVGGTTAWRMIWCALEGVRMKFWNYPEEKEANKAPIFEIDMITCPSRNIRQPSEEVTLRLNAFVIDTNDGRNFVFATNFKHERLRWCDKLNELLEYIQLWSVDGETSPGISFM